MFASSSCSYFVLTRDYLHCFKRASGSANERISDMGQFIFKVSDIVSGGMCVCVCAWIGRGPRDSPNQVLCVCVRDGLLCSTLLVHWAVSAQRSLDGFVCVQFQVTRMPTKKNILRLDSRARSTCKSAYFSQTSKLKIRKRKKKQQQHDAHIILYLALLRFSPIFRIEKKKQRSQASNTTSHRHTEPSEKERKFAMRVCEPWIG